MAYLEQRKDGVYCIEGSYEYKYGDEMPVFQEAGQVPSPLAEINQRLDDLSMMILETGGAIK